MRAVTSFDLREPELSARERGPVVRRARLRARRRSREAISLIDESRTRFISSAILCGGVALRVASNGRIASPLPLYEPSRLLLAGLGEAGIAARMKSGRSRARPKARDRTLRVRSPHFVDTDGNAPGTRSPRPRPRYALAQGHAGFPRAARRADACGVSRFPLPLRVMRGEQPPPPNGGLGSASRPPACSGFPP